MENMGKYQVPIEKLRKVCCGEELNFCKTTQDMLPPEGFIGQEQAVRAMQFGLSIKAPGYNIFVAALQVPAKAPMSRLLYLKRRVGGSVPADWCYIYNFTDKDHLLRCLCPRVRGAVLKKQRSGFLSSLADLSVNQSLAVTGSVNQFGEIQPIGGRLKR
ncbi:MAG: AAA family ATPase [Desulfotomaculaceae bacterium]|nr:AAA family ATPase [Desulfotomaculaceae bacterium]MDD4766551.1 AAA family ATPase [Desulfotomaculaceae bacterium]